MQLAAVPPSGVGAPMRLPLLARAVRGGPASSPSRRRARPPLPKATSPQSLLPPRDKLRNVRLECLALDRELKVLENSGHSRLGVFARPLVTQISSHPAAADEAAAGIAVSEADDECRDPFFHQFYDHDGRSLFEQLLRARMRAVALAKLAFGTRSAAFARAEVELAEAYARLNLWKQGHPHILTAKSVLSELEKASVPSETASAAPGATVHWRNTLFARALAYFYELQEDDVVRGRVDLASLLGHVQLWQDELSTDRDECEEDTSHDLLGRDALVQAFEAAPSIHWQQLLLKLERESSVMQRYHRQLEEKLPPEALSTVRDAFAALDHDGRVSVAAFIAQLDQQRKQLPRSALHVLRAVAAALRATHDDEDTAMVVWSEVLELANPPADDNDDDDDEEDEREIVRELGPRAELFLSRVFLRRGQIEDAVRTIHLAIASQERSAANRSQDSDALVPFYMAAAEILAVRAKQLRARSQQDVLDQVERWLQSPDGTRSVRSRALTLIDTHCHETKGEMLPKKEAEAQATEQLRHERAACASANALPNGAAVLDEAIEYCNKAWSLQEQHLGRDHVATATVHASLAQLQLAKEDPDEAVRCLLRAVSVVEGACNGPVPASAFLQLDIARVHHARAKQEDDGGAARRAQTAYLTAGDFFHSFAREFTDGSSTSRECCALALDAFHHWTTLAGSVRGSVSSLDEQREVLTRAHTAAIDGYGEFSLEASDAARDLARLLQQIGGETNLSASVALLKQASEVLASHYGPADRRARDLRKEALAVRAELRDARTRPGGVDGGQDDGAWLTI